MDKDNKLPVHVRWLLWKQKNPWFHSLLIGLELFWVLVRNRVNLKAFAADMAIRMEKMDKEIAARKRTNAFLRSKLDGLKELNANTEKDVRGTGD